MTNEVWFGDHHKIDLFVLDENDNLVRPWMTLDGRLFQRKSSAGS